MRRWLDGADLGCDKSDRLGRKGVHVQHQVGQGDTHIGGHGMACLCRCPHSIGGSNNSQIQVRYEQGTHTQGWHTLKCHADR